MEIYKDLSSSSAKEFESLLNAQLSKVKIEEGKIIDGKITKINPGPSAGLAPKANTVVNIAIPAIRAIPVSSIKTQIAELKRFCSFLR